MSRQSAVIAVTRFGLGAKPGELSAVAQDPKAWLQRQLQHDVHTRTPMNYGPDKVLIAEYLNNLRNKKLAKAAKNAGQARQIYMDQSGARVVTHIRSSQPFFERLVMFWSNHFTVSAQKKIIAVLANSYENEAIRPHVNGTFLEMLLAVCQHPAMLVYLDNAQSIGANSTAGQRRNKGLNENLARELLELHTLGVASGYTQKDVIALAQILTGWTLDRNAGKVKMSYKFQALAHEPGNKVLLGRTYKEQGEQEGIQALKWLATHPATAKHIATKLARHFISDSPPESAVQSLTKSFIDSGGHLPTLMDTLISLDSAWTATPSKFKTSYEYAISAFRLTGIEPTAAQAMASLEALNFRPFYAPSPAGYDDVAAAWLSPDALMKRIEWSKRLALRMPGGSKPMQLADAAFGDALSGTTRKSLERAASGSDAIALLLSSPEFQRR